MYIDKDYNITETSKQQVGTQDKTEQTRYYNYNIIIIIIVEIINWCQMGQH